MFLYGLFAFRSYLSVFENLRGIYFMKTARPTQNHSDNRADSRLQYLERKFCHSRCGRRVDKSSAERVADNHYNSAERHADTRANFGCFLRT